MTVFGLGVVVLLTLAVCFLPFLHSLDSVVQVFVRMFPFNRGLFEDKVANFWCALSLVYKIKTHFDASILSKIRSFPHCS